MTNQFETSQAKILERMRQNLPNVRRQPSWKNKILNCVYLFCVVFTFGLSLSSWVLLADQVKINSVFVNVVGFNLSGWMWLWFPELLIFAVVSMFITYILYRSRDFFVYKYADWVLSSVTFIVVVLFGAYLIVPTQANTNLDSLDMVKNIRNSANLTSYRLYWRDRHIEDLKTKQEFYGAVSGKNKNIIQIDHAGVILDFKCEIENCENIKIGELMWVKFKLGGETNQVIEYKII
jgi:hypothetical protein